MRARSDRGKAFNVHPPTCACTAHCVHAHAQLFLTALLTLSLTALSCVVA